MTTLFQSSTKRTGFAFAIACVLLTSWSAAQDAGAPALVAGSRPACVAVRQFSRFNGSGYNHLVEVRNACRAPVVCHVTSTSNPQATHVTVPSGDTQLVTAFFNAAGYGFTATVHCDGH
jgi:hypothetical protein